MLKAPKHHLYQSWSRKKGLWGLCVILEVFPFFWSVFSLYISLKMLESKPRMLSLMAVESLELLSLWKRSVRSTPDSSVYTEALEMFSAEEQHLTPGEKAFLPGALVLTPQHAEFTLNKRPNLHFLGWLLFSPARANSLNSELLCENCSCGDLSLWPVSELVDSQRAGLIDSAPQMKRPLDCLCSNPVFFDGAFHVRACVHTACVLVDHIISSVLP